MRRIKEFLKNRVQEASKNQKGFSLVELIIVIAILGVIAAIAIPNVTGALNDSRKQADITNAKAIANAVAILEAKEVGGSGHARSVDDVTFTYTEIHENVVKELNGTTPKSKLLTNGKFFVAINKSGSIKVAIGTKVTDAVEVYPSATGTNWAE